MARIPFDIKYRPLIEGGEYKVETRDGKPVRIICWDRKYGYPICGLVYEKETDREYYINLLENGRKTLDGMMKTSGDLFIITTERELSEFEKIRQAISYAISTATHQDGTLINNVTKDEALAYLEKQKEQNPEESDAIKGGDFISDGKRVFLVLANVKERNLGETYSTFCEGLILGVDGVVYCNGDDFKKFKRATSDERAKFIHDLKVGVELKEQPTVWSEEDKTMLERCISKMTNIIPVPGNHGLTNMSFEKHTDEKPASWLKSLPERFNLQPKQEWSEEEHDYYDAIIAKLEVTQDDAMLTDGQMSFLKSIPERFNIQPKQERGEEDDDCKTKCIRANLAVLTWEDIDRIDDLMYLERDKYGDAWNITMQEETCKTVLKKFNEERGYTTQPHWVPSQEQMDALLKLEEAYVLEHEKNQETAHLYMVIKSLREELFKLMK